MEEYKKQLRAKMVILRDGYVTKTAREKLLRTQMKNFIENADIDFSKDKFAITVNYFEEPIMSTGEHPFTDADDYKKLIIDLKLIDIEKGGKYEY